MSVHIVWKVGKNDFEQDVNRYLLLKITDLIWIATKTAQGSSQQPGMPGAALGLGCGLGRGLVDVEAMLAWAQ